MADVAEQRLLLAIMFTDVVGYTALPERDEAAAVRVRDRHRDLVRTLVGQFDGVELLDGANHIEAGLSDPRGLRLISAFLADEPAR